MSEAAMMSESECRSAKSAKNVEIRGLSRQRHGGRGKRRLAVEPGAPQACAG